MSEQPSGPEGPAEGGLPYQMDVYFAAYPTLDLAALARYIDGCEPGAFEACEVRPVGDDDRPNAQGLRVGAFAAFQGSMSLGALVHNVPSPAAHLIEHAALPEATRQQLAAHSAFALLTVVAGDDLIPVERVLFLYKVAAGLCEQGALGVGNLHTGRALPSEALRELFGKPPAEEEASIWEVLRDYGEPIELLAQFHQLELLGKRYLATCGYGQCGLPDLVWEWTNAAEADEVAQMFKNVFGYMMQHGPCIRPGHTVGYTKDVAFRFTEPPEGLELPYPTTEVLLMRKERARK
jgi:hypothetical protein